MAPAHAKKLRIQACRTDDVSLMEQAIEYASHPDSRDTVDDIYTLDHGAVAQLHGKDVFPTVDEFSKDEKEKPLMEVFEILIAHEWDVNNRGDGRSLPWWVVQYPDLVQWCLDHGASIDDPGPSRRGYSYDPPQFSADGGEIRHSSLRGPSNILGVAARVGNVETFEPLRERGAPLDPRTLHIAVQSSKMDMVRHLVDVVGLDVNAIEHEVGNNCSTPLCYLYGPRPFRKHQSRLLDFLLDRGANLDLDCGNEGAISWQSPNQIAQQYGNVKFLQAVQEWPGRQQEAGADRGVSGTTQPELEG
ncbi:hypothetical protein B0A48_18351 [Cryoendolithus antarcticus]|uniref:Uncharacterized protein n=1 Tax=Cryoendolithus antarcticus TaxID=1507870 RepID=A0A1V8SAB7_9PEZI|nr:hypothetical protein B0A48_18351 [Cryoendolithus antarcticus]